MGFLPSFSMMRLAFGNLFRRKSRTALALLGIVIGVMAILVMVGVVDGVLGEFNGVISQFQGIMVMERDAVDTTFSKIDADTATRLEGVAGVRTVVPELWYLPTEIEGKKGGLEGGEGGFDVLSTSVYGVDPSEYAKLRGTGWVGDIYRGRMLNSGERDSVVVGRVLADNLNKFVGGTLDVEGKKFRIRGIAESESGLLGSLILMHIEDARELSSFPSEKVNSFFVELTDPTRDKEVASKVNFLLGEDGEALTTGDFSAQFNSVVGNFRLVAFFVAAISALVAGVGIANTMLMSVMERTGEIGALKATGWTGENILTLIMLESIFLGVMGGVIGILGSFAVTSLITSVFNVSTLLSNELLVQAFAFAVLVGLISGIYPAWRASNLNPVEAVHSG